MTHRRASNGGKRPKRSRRYTPPKSKVSVTVGSARSPSTVLEVHLRRSGCTCNYDLTTGGKDENGAHHITVEHDAGCPLMVKRNAGTN